ncbi:hypothetical protein B4903_21990 [Yersinia frederiksenii]|nr:hypothetical protein B4903_21990 [Yersinia frederiksenii]
MNRISDDEALQLNIWLDLLDEVNLINTSETTNINWPQYPASIK